MLLWTDVPIESDNVVEVFCDDDNAFVPEVVFLLEGDEELNKEALPVLPSDEYSKLDEGAFLLSVKGSDVVEIDGLVLLVREMAGVEMVLSIELEVKVEEKMEGGVVLV